MPKEPQGQKRRTDLTGNAVMAAMIATGEIEDTTLKQPARRKSGLVGSKARAGKLTSKERSEIARKHAGARWE